MLYSACRKYHLVDFAVFKIHNDLVPSVCRGKPSVLVLLDFSASYDTIDRKMLLDDLYEMGMHESALSVRKS